MLEDRWLVELDHPALLADPSPAARRLLGERQEALRRALQGMEPGESGHRPRVLRSHGLLWAGLAVEADDDQARRIRALPGVREVYPERPVWALLDASVPLIGATALHEAVPSVTGDAITIAVVDTGVDYTHPDLGGGFGPGFKVRAGRDFVDGDNDPLDQHGHGTHVAAIAAGDGTADGQPWPGVAPGASILAVRVLNAGATGTQSDLIAGLEYAADPDGDPGTLDGAQVVLTALGGFGHPDDPVSQAADALSAAGAIVVAGAGNFANPGTTYQSILSPATARNVLAVGATDGTDAPADFSSRGFTGDFLPKPDLAAPGTDICAARHANFLAAFTCQDSVHVETSGTSLAAAHVAGAAALVMEANPDWEAEEVRNALRETALDLGADLLTQGSGRLRVDRAAAADAVARPEVLVPGRVDLCAADWSGAVPLVVQNLGAFPADFDLTLVASPPVGVSLTLDDSVLTVAPGSEGSTMLRAQVDTSQAPVQDMPPFGFTGVVDITSADRPGLELRVPVWVPASPSLPLSFGFQPREVYVHDRAGTTWRYVAPGREMEAALPVGTYDVLALGPQGRELILREGVTVEACGTTPLAVEISEAVHRVDLDWTARSGEILPSNPVRCELVLRHDGGFFYQAANARFNLLRLSDASGSYRVEWSCADRDTAGDLHVGLGGVQGLTGDLAAVVGPQDWGHMVVAPRRDAAEGPLWLGATLARAGSGPTPLLLSPDDLTGPGPDPVDRRRSLWQAPLPWDDFLALAGSVSTVGPDPWPPVSTPASLRSLLPVADASGTLVLFPGEGTDRPVAVLPSGGAPLTLGLPPFAWAAETRNQARLVRLFPARGDELALFRGQLGTHRPRVSSSTGPGLDYEIRQGAFQDSGSLTHFGPFFTAPLLFGVPDPAPTELEVRFPGYRVAGTSGVATALLGMDTGAVDPDPPALWRLQVLQNGLPTDVVLGCGDPARIRADFTEDAGSFSEIALELRPSGDPSWTPLTPSLSGGGLEAPVSLFGTDGLVDLRLSVRDATGNLLQVRAEPALRELPAGPASDPADSLRLRRLGGDVELLWAGEAQGAYGIRRGRRLPLGPGDDRGPVAGPLWLDSGAATSRGQDHVDFYDVRAVCP